MNLSYFIDRFAQNRDVLIGFVRNVGADQAKWKPEPDKWSILEVINHLYDEEREDFRQRLELVLTDPAKLWPKIDPRGWVTSRNYLGRTLEASMENFLAEREKSLSWLGQLSNPNWDNRNEGANGILSAGDLLASWLAHDFLHVRQITRLHWQYVSFISLPYSATYAGPWKEP
ncbi:MAG TPA: DinB family protein [Pyrinomonadaceae bacterium]|nr:DinB family protein [Pyrinomonadaceae bacterium]